jgi:hypothetical protein
LGIGDLTARFREKAAKDAAEPDAWVFHQKRSQDKPLWDSGVRDALHQAAQEESCDFPGLGYSYRRAHITWRQQVGGSPIEAAETAGQIDLEMTGDYPFVAPERQNELTRRIQQRLADATNTVEQPSAVPAPDGGSSHPNLEDAGHATWILQ